jgi:hypothetical protein
VWQKVTHQKLAGNGKGQKEVVESGRNGQKVANLEEYGRKLQKLTEMGI